MVASHSNQQKTNQRLKCKQIEVTGTLVSQEFVGKTCSICSNPVFAGEIMVCCPYCKLPFHEECWKEIGGCGTYGCQAAPDLPKSETVPRDEYQPGWAAEKICPVCRAKINASALKCRVCHTVFPTEKPMTPEEYKNREYDGMEEIAVRTRVIGMFILSTIGCLCFISIPLNIYHILGNEWLFNVRRLSPTLKILFYSATVISCLWGVLGLLFLLFSS